MPPPDPSIAWLSWIHPALMALGLILAFLALWNGLRIRDRRRQRLRREKNDWLNHVRWSQPAVILILVGFSLGLPSAFFLRHVRPLHTLHGWVGLTAAVLFAAVGWMGLRIKKGDRRHLVLHGNLGLLAILLSVLVAILGIQLLP